MNTSPHPLVFRKQYTPPSYWVKTVDLHFDLDPKITRVTSKVELFRNPKSKNKDIILYGTDCDLISLHMNNSVLTQKDYVRKGEVLRIPNAPKNAILQIETLIQPEKNTSLMGLYVSNGNFFTQCEAEGFRKITFFPDRPDVMAQYTVTLMADKKNYPVLLSNGNLIEKGDLPKGKHYTKWEDPFKKPSYLFALVAGKLICQEETLTLKSGREALLQVWVEKGNLDKTTHAMKSLKHSILWDEERYGLELDLDRFMIVAVSDFNMGAMENKGLNIFNTKFVLANPEIATDTDYENIEAVVGHEYFHNWTGNRVTCRDWFQLSLKEGLTVFRDQEFTADRIGSESGRAVKRIGDVRYLRQLQFPEDAGAMAHPVRPDSYSEINNFYTVTIYEKGSEVVRMYQTLLGHEGFRQGMDLYFKRHDGQAVECKDFLNAMADANHRNLRQFERWYSQAGTPRVKLQAKHDAKNQTLTIKLSQSCPPTPNQDKKLPFLIPIAIGLLDSKGEDMLLYCNQLPKKPSVPTTAILELNRRSQTFTFTKVKEKPVLSTLRNFSAPIILEYEQTDEELMHLLQHDSDSFNRWEAGQRLAMRRLTTYVDDIAYNRELIHDPKITFAFQSILTNTSLDPAFKELILTLPTDVMISEQMDIIDPQAITKARHFMCVALAKALKDKWLHIYENNQSQQAFIASHEEAGRRSLKNLALSYLIELGEKHLQKLAIAQFNHADNMTDRLAALTALVHSNDIEAQKEATQCLHQFYKKYESEALVIDKWFTLQATSPAINVKNIRKLAKHYSFTLKNPNRARSLVFSFCNNNMAQFHAKDGSGYEFWAEYVIALDQTNPQIAARLARSLSQWYRYISPLRNHAQDVLQLIKKRKLSRDTHEVINKLLHP